MFIFAYPFARALPRLSLAAACALGLAAPASASVTVFTSPTQLQSAGTILASETFDSAPLVADSADPAYGTYAPGPDYVVGPVTFTSTANLVVGPSNAYGVPLVRALLMNNDITPLTATITEPSYDLFGFSYGSIGAPDVTVQLGLSDGELVSWTDSAPPDATVSLAFVGFQAPSGTDFTSFTISTSDPFSGEPGITDLTFGQAGGVAGVPEPAAWALIMLGLFGLGAALRARRAALPAVA